MANNFDAAFKFTLGHEGGWGNDPHDRGNWTSGVIGKGENKGTKYGIAAHVYPTLDIKNLTLEQAKAIYKRDYWGRVAGDRMPAGVDLSVWDMAVNAGPARGLALLQSALGIASASAATTLAAQADLVKDKVALIKRYAAKRLGFYQGLSTFGRYGRGWSRRAAECEAVSVKLALTSTPGAQASPGTVDKVLANEQAQAKTAAKGHTTGAATVTGGEGVNASTHQWALDWATAGQVVVLVIIAGVVLYFGWKALAHNDRAKAYADALKGKIGLEN